MVVEVAVTAVLEATACIFFSDRVPYIVAVMAAPVAALMAATMAKVVFDMVKIERKSCPAWKEAGFLYTQARLVTGDLVVVCSRQVRIARELLDDMPSNLYARGFGACKSPGVVCRPMTRLGTLVG